MEQQLIDVATAWDRAMVTNDADFIGRFMAHDWTIIGPDGSSSSKDAFLGLIRSGALTHGEMTSQDFRVCVYGETAVLTFVKQDGQWKCALTHLSKLPGTLSA